MIRSLLIGSRLNRITYTYTFFNDVDFIATIVIILGDTLYLYVYD